VARGREKTATMAFSFGGGGRPDGGRSASATQAGRWWRLGGPAPGVGHFGSGILDWLLAHRLRTLLPMTRLAILSDVHADLSALRDALARIERMGIELVVCAGDLVDYGLHPEETIQLLRDEAVPCIRGNHDRWALERARQPPKPGAKPLPKEALAFLDALPLAWNRRIEDVRVAVRHGTPRSDMHGIFPEHLEPDDARRFLEQAEAEVLIVGHTHIPFALSTLGGGLIVNPGALLREPDRSKPHPPTGGTFGVLDLPSRDFRVHRAVDGEEIEILRRTVGVRDRR